MKSHYWIENKQAHILNVYKLLTPGDRVVIKRKIYKKLRTIKTNRTISMIENRVISEMNIEDSYNRVVLSDKCILLYNDHQTIIEMDGYSSETALYIFSMIANNEDEFILFDIDDNSIVSE